MSICEKCNEEIVDGNCNCRNESFIDKYLPIVVKYIKVTFSMILKYLIIIGIFLWKLLMEVIRIVGIFVKKNHKEKWFYPLLGVILIIFVIIIIPGKRSPAFVDRTLIYSDVLESSDRSKTIKVDDLGVEVELPGEISDSDLDFSIEPVSVSFPSFATDGFAIDVNLGNLHYLPGISEIKIAYDKDLVPKGEDASKYVSAMYLNGSTWEYVYYEVDEKNSEVTIKTDHFSIFGIFFGDDTPDNKEVESVIDQDELLDLGSLNGLQVAYSDINKYVGIGSQVGKMIDGVLVLPAEAISNLEFMKGINPMTTYLDTLGKYGDAVFIFDLAYKMYEGKTKEVNVDILKKLVELGVSNFSSVASKFGGAAMFAIDYSLSEFTKAAFEGAEENWNKTYQRYYDESEYMARSALEWRNTILDIYDNNNPEDYYGSEPYTDYLNKLVDAEIDNYLSLIWNDIETAYLAASDLGIGRLNVPSDTVKTKLQANYKKELYDARIYPSFTSISKILVQRTELARANELRDLANELTRTRTIFLDDVEGTFKITNGVDVLVEGQIMDDIEFTLNEYIELGVDDLYLEVNVNSEISNIALPSEFPMFIYHNLSLEENSISRDVDALKEEYEFDFIDVKNHMHITQQETESYIIDRVADLIVTSPSNTYENQTTYTSEDKLFSLTVIDNKEEFGYQFEKLYLVSYSNDINHISAYLDPSGTFYSMYISNSEWVYDYGKWSGGVEGYRYRDVANNTQYDQAFMDGLLRNETLTYSGGDQTIFEYNDTGVKKIIVNGETKYE